MKIVIVGAGAVGFDLARTLSRRDHDVIIIEKEPRKANRVQEQLDCRIVIGNGANPHFLTEVGMKDCDLFASVTDKDEVNIISCLTAHRLGAGTKVARVRSADYYRDDHLVLDGIDLAINPELEAIRTVKQLLFETAASDVHEFAAGRVRVVGARVAEDSPVAGISLAEIESKLGSRWALVITVVRDGETLIPRGDTIIQPSDQVYVAGSKVAVDRALSYVQAPKPQLKNVMIVGANQVGIRLAGDLQQLGLNVKLIDRNKEKCQNATDLLHGVLVLHGDGTDVELLKSEGVEEIDGFVSVSKEEETNLMACLLANFHGARKTICRVNRPNYVPLLPLLGVDAAVSPRLSASDAIARFVKRGSVVSTHSLGFSGSEILQLHLSSGCKCLGKPLATLSFPRTAVIGAVLNKNGRVITPRGDTVLSEGDEVVVFSLPDGVADVEKFFGTE
jgi:trk system potassium uptake protein